MAIKLAFSSENSGVGPNEAETRRRLGTAHYSYGFVAKKFRGALQRYGIDAAFVEMPEAFKYPRAYQSLLGADAADVVHLAFRSTENLRPMAGARNICHFAWEFPVLKQHAGPGESLTSSQLHMLRLMDQVWVPCAYTREVLMSYGLEDVKIVPTPICGDEPPTRMSVDRVLDLLSSLPTVPLNLSSGLFASSQAAICGAGLAPLGRFPQVAAKRDGRPSRIFLTVCNPGDLRKNLLGILDGFQLATRGSIEDFLIVKLVVRNIDQFRETSLRESILPLLRGPGAYFDDRIVFIADFLTDDELGALYSLADFYISAAHCEGFNLPLLEAMSYGTVPIATANTAMADYIDDDIATIIEERSYPTPIPGMAGDIAGESYPLAVASRFDVARAILSATRLSKAEWGRRSSAARARVAQKYGSNTIVSLIGELIPGLFAEEESLAEEAEPVVG